MSNTYWDKVLKYNYPEQAAKWTEPEYPNIVAEFFVDPMAGAELVLLHRVTWVEDGILTYGHTRTKEQAEQVVWMMTLGVRPLDSGLLLSDSIAHFKPARQDGWWRFGGK